VAARNNQTSFDEIPEALRESPTLPHQKRHRRNLRRMLGSMGLGLLAMMITIYWGNSHSESSRITKPSQKKTMESQPLSSGKEEEAPETLLGHFAYQPAPPDTLTELTADGRVTLATPAAKQFRKMKQAARQDGILLVPLSGFRSVQKQKELFFGIKAKRGQSLLERAQVSAPPGYSEHHTGYAIDIGDANHPETNFQQAFEETAAFEWLQQHAANYNFELSFPKDNPQGIQYEPWHWRYVGNQESLEQFYGKE